MRRVVQKHPTLAARSLSRLALATLMVGTLLLGTRAADAAGPGEQPCQKGRYDAAAKYAACQQRTLAKFVGGGVPACD